MSVVVLCFLSSSLVAHSLFLKLDTYFLAPYSKVSVQLVNGEFSSSENAIARDRMLDVSVIGPDGEVAHPPKSDWRDVGETAVLDLDAGPPGTYCIGVSTAPRVIELEAERFNTYLENDGVLDMLEEREREGNLGVNARESYAKHVKAIIQVGQHHSGAYAARLGYPIEIVPLQNPYRLTAGDELEVLVLKKGEPLAGQRLYGSHEGHHVHDEGGAHVEPVSTRTDHEGRAAIPLTHAGRWYLRLINMVESGKEDLDYVSEWATLTFQIRPAPPTLSGESAADDEGAFPWAWIAGAVLVVLCLVLIIRRRL